MADTTRGPAPDARTLASSLAGAELQAAMSFLRDRGGTEVARAAMRSRGDVTMVEGYGSVRDCIARLQSIEAYSGAGTMGPALRAAAGGHSALLHHAEAFKAAFAGGGQEGARFAYAGAVMALWATVTMLCADAVVWEPGPDGGLRPRVDAAGAGRVADSLPADRLGRFADAAGRYGFERALNGEAPIGESFWDVAVQGAKALGLALAATAVLLYIARDVVAWWFRTRVSWTQWLETQAAFLEMNAAALGPQRRQPRDKQLEYAARLRRLAAYIRVDAAHAQRDAGQDLRGEKAPGPGEPRLV